MLIKAESDIDRIGKGIVINITEDCWWFVSRRGETLKLRDMDGELDDVTMNIDSLRAQETELLIDCQFINSGRVKQTAGVQLSYEGRKDWPLIKNCLIREGLSVLFDDNLVPLPVTRLRSLYQLLRKMNDRKEIVQPLVSVFEQKPEVLADLYVDSVALIESFDNRNEPLSVERQPTDGSNTSKWALNTVQQFEKHKSVAVKIENHEVCDYLDREVAPLRKIGYTDSSKGGIDALLRSASGNVIVAELKAVTDSGPFLALIQALTYTAELSTRKQKSRKLRFENDGTEKETGFDESKPAWIFVIVENACSMKAQERRDLEAVTRIASTFLAHLAVEDPATGIEKIEFLTDSRSESGEFRLERI